MNRRRLQNIKKPVKMFLTFFNQLIVSKIAKSLCNISAQIFQISQVKNFKQNVLKKSLLLATQAWNNLGKSCAQSSVTSAGFFFQQHFNAKTRF